MVLAIKIENGTLTLAGISASAAQSPRPIGQDPGFENNSMFRYDLRRLEASFLDQAPDGFGTALSFFSHEAFRYYLPGYLLADVDDAKLLAAEARVIRDAAEQGEEADEASPSDGASQPTPSPRLSGGGRTLALWAKLTA